MNYRLRRRWRRKLVVGEEAIIPFNPEEAHCVIAWNVWTRTGLKTKSVMALSEISRVYTE